MAFSFGYCNYIRANRLYLNRIARDGFNASNCADVAVSDSDFEWIIDDCCAANLSGGAAGDLGQQRAFRFLGNRVYDAQGVKVLGGKHILIADNSFRAPLNYAVFLGSDASYGEGGRPLEDAMITGNNVTDLVTADQFGNANIVDTGIIVSQTLAVPHNVIIRGNNLAQRTPTTDLTWSELKLRGIDGENRQWRMDVDGNMLFYDPTLTGEIFVGQGKAIRVEAPNGLDRLTYDIDDNRFEGFSEDAFLRSQQVWTGEQLWAVPASAGEFPVGAAARLTGLDLRGYQEMRLVLAIGGSGGLAGTAQSWFYSLDGAATWTDTGAQVVLDGTPNQTLYGGWQTIPAGLRPRINVTAALFGQGGNGSTQVEMTGFSFDIRGIDVGELDAVVVDEPDQPAGVAQLLHRRRQVALEDHVADQQHLAGPVPGIPRQHPIRRAVRRVVAAGQPGGGGGNALVPAAIAAAGQLQVHRRTGIDAGLVRGVADHEIAGHQQLARLAGRFDRRDRRADVGVVGAGRGALQRDHLGRKADRRERRALGRGHEHLAAAVGDLVGGVVAELRDHRAGAAIYKILGNRTYLGEAVHKGSSFPGEHAAIIDRATWDKVHAVLADNRVARANGTRAQTPALLRGLIFAPVGHAMTPSHTRKAGKLYRYYVASDAIRQGYAECPVRSVPAAEVEEAVVAQVRHLLRSPEIIARTWAATKQDGDEAIPERELVKSITDLAPLWDELFPAEQARIVRLLVERIDLSPDGMRVRLRAEGLRTLVEEIRLRVAA